MPTGFSYGAMAFSPDGLWLATGSQRGEVSLWDPLKGERVWDVGRHQDNLYKLDFGPDGRTLLSGADDGLCYLWDLRPLEASEETDFQRLWDSLHGEDSRVAYQAMWDLAEISDAVSLLPARLRALLPVGGPDGHKDRRRSVAIRRAVAVLARIGTPEATQALKDLAAADPNGDVARLASAALYRLGRIKVDAPEK
jgi:hypothetical protein